MIGDGVNDVLSLKKANLAISMGSGSQATRGVADLVLMDDSFAAVAQAVEEGQRILNGMQDILKLFLTRIATVGLVVVSSLVVGLVPDRAAQRVRAHDLHRRHPERAPRLLGAARPARAGIARPDAGRRSSSRPRSCPASWACSCSTPRSRFAGRAGSGRRLAAATAQARTALTTFLVFAGLFLIVFVEPPIEWFAVAEPISPDRRPTILAIVLAVGYVAVLLTPAAREFFSFALPGPREALLAVGSAIVWVPLVRLFWKRRLVDRFLGLA